VTYEVPMRRGTCRRRTGSDLGGQTRVVALDFAGTLFSYSTDGTESTQAVERRLYYPESYVPRGPNGLTTTICDLDGDGKNEVLALTMDEHGTTTVTGVDEEGRIKLRIEPIEGTYEPELGGVGSLGAGKGSWFVVRYRRKFASEMVVSYDGKTGKKCGGAISTDPQESRRQSSCCISNSNNRRGWRWRRRFARRFRKLLRCHQCEGQS